MGSGEEIELRKVVKELHDMGMSLEALATASSTVKQAADAVSDLVRDIRAVLEAIPAEDRVQVIGVVVNAISRAYTKRKE